MKNIQFVGGILIAVLAAMIFIIVENPRYIPVAITLMIVGIGLIATGRNKRT
jgi:uncharacterized membrane protein YccC